MASLFSLLVSALLIAHAIGAEGEACTGFVEYTVAFQGNWTEDNHPGAWVSNAHFSPPVAVVHNEEYALYTVGEKASEGVEQVAEIGATTDLTNELQVAQGKGTVGDYDQGNALFNKGQGITTMEVSACSKFPLVSVITMIAPSPDWFTGVNAFSLCDTESGQWETSAFISVYPYDAGTDSGADFNSANDNTSPAEPVTAMGQVYGAPEDVLPVGYLIIERVSENSTMDCETLGNEGEPPDSGSSSSSHHLPFLAVAVLAVSHALLYCSFVDLL